MSIVHVPFHQDQRLADADVPIPAGADVVPVHPDFTESDAWSRMSQLHELVADAVGHEVSAGVVPAVLSGDCLVSLGVVAGVQRAGVDTSIIWFDAHGDVHTAATSTSGYAGGMALRLLLGGHCESVAAPLGLRPLPEARATLVDARDLDPAESEYLATAAIHRHEVGEIDSASLPRGPVVLHVDVDVIDPAEFSGLRFPVSGGPTAEIVLAATRKIRTECEVVALHVACPWHAPTGDEHARRERLLAALTGPIPAPSGESEKERER